ncbi:MAG: 16S rRNA (cytidine(1402)-2'-O)-methyltransferase [Coriobacteriales bacterium]|nr:16S rRNA (cytidine(1402)-2'-O)-methyltransferase [Coriobacteriales bacterium]
MNNKNNKSSKNDVNNTNTENNIKSTNALKAKTVVIALGSNMSTNYGDPEATLRAAIKRLKQVPGLTINKVSSYIHTVPLYNTMQPDFCNAVALATTMLEPLVLLRLLQAIEHEFGRERYPANTASASKSAEIPIIACEPNEANELNCEQNHKKKQHEQKQHEQKQHELKPLATANNPRTLDLDITDYEGVVSDDPVLMLPHPLAAERPFVIDLLHEIAPEYVLADNKNKQNNVEKRLASTGAMSNVNTLASTIAIANTSPLGNASVLANTDTPTNINTLTSTGASENANLSPDIGWSLDSTKSISKTKVKSKGKLSICATPIGNLGDITKRVVTALQTADVILAEDTRVTRKLLTHLNISSARLERCDENTIRLRADKIIASILAGEHIVYVSDAGTPCISDPGAVLVVKAHAAKATIEVLPGACAALAAYVLSGFGGSNGEAQAFYFGGFLPKKHMQRVYALKQLLTLNAALIFYESPHRVIKSLGAIAEVFPMRKVLLARELTKLYEESMIGAAAELISVIEQREQSGQIIRGEVVLVISPPVTEKQQSRSHKDKYAREEQPFSG